MNIRDSQDSFEAGKKNYQKFLEEIVTNWYAPALVEELVIQLMQLPPEALNSLTPEARSALGNLLGGQGNATRKSQESIYQENKPTMA